jgi:hypothetical protein
LGTCCKHQAAVYFFFSKELPNAPQVTAKYRYDMAVLAFGDKAQPLSFYNSLNAEEEMKENNCGKMDTNTTYNTSQVVINDEQPEMLTNKVLNPVQHDFQNVIHLMTHHNDKFRSTNESLNLIDLESAVTPGQTHGSGPRFIIIE